jgi:Na+/proline symporter
MEEHCAASLVLTLDLIDGWNVFVQNIDSSRLNIIDFSNTGIGSSQEFGFWPMVVGGFFLYSSYYGCDQSQAQRMLSAKDLDNVRKGLMFNGLVRFPLVLLYCFMGLLIGTYAMMTPSFAGQIPADSPDYLVPVFIVEYLPHGIIGLLIVAIFSAAMSSLDSALNSLSAATVEDLILRSNNAEELSSAEQMRYSKITTLGWGIVCIILAFSAGSIAETIIEAINKMGSLFYGPIIATFVLAILTNRTNTVGMNLGIIAGVLFNFVLWIFFSDVVFWFWWNFTGFAVTALVAYSYSAIYKHGHSPDLVELSAIKYRIPEAMVLGGYFILIILFSSIIAML